MIKFEFAPINTGFTKDGIYDERIINFHRARAGKNIETAYVGNVSVDATRKTNNSTAIFVEKNLHFLEKIVEVISQEGSLPGIQIASKLSTVAANRSWQGDRKTHVKAATEEIMKLSDDDFDKEILLIKNGINFSVQAGFSVVQLHAAHGYLLSRLFNKQINKRTGRFAFGNLDWFGELTAFTKILSSRVIFDVRLNMLDGIDNNTIEIAYKQPLIKELIDHGCQKISFTNGFYDVDKKLIYPNDSQFANENLARSTAIAEKHPDVSFSVAGNMLSTISMQSQLPINLSIALGRAFIADPNAVLKFKAGQAPICTFCGECHYYSLGKECLSCPVSRV